MTVLPPSPFVSAVPNPAESAAPVLEHTAPADDTGANLSPRAQEDCQGAPAISASNTVVAGATDCDISFVGEIFAYARKLMAEDPNHRFVLDVPMFMAALEEPEPMPIFLQDGFKGAAE